MNKEESRSVWELCLRGDFTEVKEWGKWVHRMQEFFAHWPFGFTDKVGQKLCIKKLLRINRTENLPGIINTASCWLLARSAPLPNADCEVQFLEGSYGDRGNQAQHKGKNSVGTGPSMRTWWVMVNRSNKKKNKYRSPSPKDRPSRI